MAGAYCHCYGAQALELMETRLEMAPSRKQAQMSSHNQLEANEKIICKKAKPTESSSDNDWPQLAQHTTPTHGSN